MTKFNPYYSKFLDQLPPSIKTDIWKRLTTRLHNPLTEEQVCGIHPDIEALLIREVDSYAKKKGRQRLKVIANATPEGSTAFAQLDEFKKRLSIRETQLDQKEHDIENVISTRVNDECNRLRADYNALNQNLDDKNKKIADLNSLLEDTKNSLYTHKKDHTSALQKLEAQYKSRASTMDKTLEEKDKKIDKLSSDIKRYKNDKEALKKTNKSTLEEINKFKNLCKQLEDIIDIKDQKIISYSKASTANPQGYSDGTIEPETFYSTYDNEKWNNLRYSAKYDPEIRKKYTFQNKS